MSILSSDPYWIGHFVVLLMYVLVEEFGMQQAMTPEEPKVLAHNEKEKLEEELRIRRKA